MRVKLDATDLSLGNNGIMLKISDPKGKHLGDLRIGKAQAEWRSTRARVGKKIPLEDLIDWLNAQKG